MSTSTTDEGQEKTKPLPLSKNVSIPVLLVTPANEQNDLRRGSINHGSAMVKSKSMRASSTSLLRQNALETPKRIIHRLKIDSRATSDPECGQKKSPRLSGTLKFFSKKLSRQPKSCELDYSAGNSMTKLFSHSACEIHDGKLSDSLEKEVNLSPTMTNMLSKWIRKALSRSSSINGPTNGQKACIPQAESNEDVNARERQTRQRRKKMIRSETIAEKSCNDNDERITDKKNIRSSSFINRRERDREPVKIQPIMSPKSQRIKAFAKHIQHSLDPNRVQSVSSTPASRKGEFVVYKGEEDLKSIVDPKSLESLRVSMEIGKYNISGQEKTGNISLMSNTDSTSITGKKEKKEKKNKNFDVRDLLHVIFNPNQPGQSEMGIPTISDEISLSTYNLAGSNNLSPLGYNNLHDHSNRKESIGIGNIFNFKSNKIASPNTGSSPTKSNNPRKSLGIAKFNPADGSISINHFLLKSGSLSRGFNTPNIKNLQRWEKSFDSLLSDEFGLYLFTEFLKTEFSQENIEFWVACEEYKKLSGSKMNKEAQRIYRTHLSVQSPKEVNLDSKTRLQTIASLNAPNRLVFDAAQKKIQALMEKDSYRRFLRSQTYLLIKNQLEENQSVTSSTPRSSCSSQKQICEEIAEEMPISPTITISSRDNSMPPNKLSQSSGQLANSEYPHTPPPPPSLTKSSTIEDNTLFPNPVSDTEDCKLSSPELL